MAKIPVSKLVAIFQEMYREHWSYEWGKAEKGCVDCSGAFDYAFKLFGIDYPHGSNAIARKYVSGKMLPISEAKAGMAAFKAKVPGEEGYDLPDKYKNSGDLNDYYHIGLVDDNPHYVLNAKGENYGFCRDALTAKNGWDCVAYLKYVDYGEEEETVPDTETVKATVVLPQGANGNTVNLREGPSKDDQIIAKVPVGSEVQVAEDKGTWCKIIWNGKHGWMMSNYIEYAGQDGETDVLTAEDRDQINKALLEIEKAAETIGCIIGRG